jgi:hypothetical protein
MLFRVHIERETKSACIIKTVKNKNTKYEMLPLLRCFPFACSVFSFSTLISSFSSPFVHEGKHHYQEDVGKKMVKLMKS